MSDEDVAAGPIEATIITPAYNEEKALPSVLAALDPLRASGIEVLVIDDGSTDRTSEVAQAAGYRVIRLERNSGKAAAVRAGLAAATGEKIVLIDADGTYPADAIPAVLRLLDEFDVVLGSRTKGRGHIPPLNRFGNAALRTAIHWFSGFRSSDPLTGLYGIRRVHLEAMRLGSRGFGLEAEMGVRAARMGLRWTDYPITYAERIGESKLNPVRDGAVITWTVIHTLFTGPRVRPAPGMGERVRPAPLAIATTALSLVMLAIAAIILGALAVHSFVTLVDPEVPLTTATAIPGLAALLGGVFLWRLAHRWGRPRPEMLAPIATAAIAAGALLMGAALLAADSVGLLPGTAGVEIAGRGLLIGAGVALVAAPTAMVFVPRGDAIGGRLAGVVSVLRSHGEVLALAAILVLFALPVVRFIAIDPIFGFDEAIYANTARSWLEGTPNTGWTAHRSPGISLLGLPAVPFGSEAAFRAVGLIAGLFAVVASWALARRLGGPAAGLLAALVIATIPELLLNSGFFLTDVPSAAIILLLMLRAWEQFEERAGPSASLLWLAPIAAAAFYVRYGASVAIALLALTALVLWPDRIRAAWRPVAATAALFLALLVPHLVQSTLMTGSPWGIALTAQSLASPAYHGQALLTYLRMLPTDLAGIVGGALIVTALVASPVLLVRGGLRDRASRAHTFLVLPAVAQLLLLGLVALAGVRYVMLPILLLVIAGSVLAARLSRRLNVSWRRTLAVTVAIAAVTSGLGTAAVELRRQADWAPTQRDIIDAARLIREDAADRPCSILGYPAPQITWYSACATYPFGHPPRAGEERLLRGERRYLILATTESDRYPSGALREEYAMLAGPEPIAIVRDRATDAPEFEIYRLPDEG